MSELDKFKRRTIRSVARLLLKEKKPPEELWQQMKKETGTDCRTLWERMRALCVKKLNRMIAVDDRSASLPSIARLSLTDWLLVDLVLVHEEIDVIAMDRADNKEYPALIELFNLVQRFDVEGRSGDPLAEAWAAATVFYNRQGRQCSPMLLQRRWYQLKKLTRCRFYKFWFSYRGNTRFLEEARKTMPSRLHMAIAKRFPDVITKEYPDWEELIEKRFVIMPEEFEAKMRMPNLPKPCNSNAPDLMLVEPVIETIDLRVESDPEDHNDDEMEDNSDPERSNDAMDVTHSATEEETQVTEEEVPVTGEENPDTEEEIPVNDEASSVEVQVTEPIEEDGLSNVKLISATHVPEVEIPDESPDENLDVAPCEVNAEEGQMDSQDDDEDDVIAIPSVAPGVLIDQLPAENIVHSGTEMPPNNAPCDVETINDSDEAVDDIIKVRAEEFCSKNNEFPAENNSTIDDLIKDKVETYLKTPKEVLSLSDLKTDTNIGGKNKAEEAAIDLMADLNFVDDGIEFVDDGVEFVEEDHTQHIESNKNITPSEENFPPVYQMEEVAEENNKFDLKLLMYPVVYTTKIDQMKIFKNKEIDSVKGGRDIEMALVESKPISEKSLKIKIKEESVTSIAEDPADSDDLFTNREATDDEDIEEDIVSPNSYMLKKPRTRTYDPIKLCKNPDFNTKLKRLTIGFLSSTRNRQLLNACIPMTIDLSKAFESKLVHGTLYLTSSGTAQTVVKQEVSEKQASSIVPTAMPVQSLIDNSKVDIENLISNPPSTLEPMVTERTKVINLPDIDKVRRINQQLLTAQVPPLRVFAGNNRFINEPPREVNQTVPTVPSIEPQPLSESTSIENTLPKIKVEGEKCADTSLPPEILPPAKEKLLKMINQAKISTKEALDKLEDATKPKDFPMPIVVKEVKNNIPPEVPTRKHHFQPRVPLAWAPKRQVITNNFDGLLTSDTLNKMLHLLMSGDKDGKGCKCCGIKKNEKKKSKCKLIEDQKDSDSSDAVQEVAKKGKGKKPAENSVNNPETQIKVVPIIKVSKTKYCCWAYQKLTNRKRISRHLCPPDPCKCCCAEKLVNKIKADEEKRRLQNELIAAKTVVELSDDEEDSLRKACESIETVVQQSVQLTDQSNNENDQEESPVVAAVTVADETQQTVVPNVTVVSSGKPVTPCINVEVVAPSISKVTIDLSGASSDRRQMPTTPPKPCIKIRAAPISSLMPNLSAKRKINRPQITVNRTPAPRLHVNVPMNSQAQTVPPEQWAPCSCRPALSQDARKFIVIDASKKCAVHPTPSAPQISPKKTELGELQHCSRHPTPIAPKQITPQKRINPVKNQETPIQKQEKILYLHSKSLSKSPSESPIFLGKNKILLTTVKFPQKNDGVAPPTEVFQSPKVIPTLPLPAGVQLVLMPSGNVTYTVDPGVELGEEQLATLPTILAAVQEQLNASGVTSTLAPSEPQDSVTRDDEPVSAITQPENSVPETKNLSQTDVTVEPQNESKVVNETTEPPITVTLETNEVFQDTELPTRSINTVNMDVEAENTNANALTERNTSATTTSDLEKEAVPILEKETAPNFDKETSPITEDPANKVTVNPDAPEDVTETLPSTEPASNVEESQNEKSQENQSAPEKKETPDDKDSSSSKKNLLSDLMEMSGISAEDTTAPEPPVLGPPVIDQVEDTANIIVDYESSNLPELSPVTSFAELKYACEQNGKFFKLDFETGVIVPINVCIKKNPKNNTSSTKTKEFIDLTDDVENTEVESPEMQDSINSSLEDLPAGSSMLKERYEYIYNGKTVNISNTVKPVKLFKAYHSSRPAPPRLLRRAGLSRPQTPEDYDFLIKGTHVQKRKQTLKVVTAKVEAKIDLIDSDEPMEEEYLVDSSDDDFSEDGRTEASRKVLEALESLDNTIQSDDSSDDEPLAKKSKRLKKVEENQENVRETNIFDEIPDVIDPNESTMVANDLVPDIETPVNSELTDQDPAVRQASVTRDAGHTINKKENKPNRKIGEPPVKVRKTLDPKVVIRTEGPIEENYLNALEDDSEDENLVEPPAKVRKTLDPKVVIRTEGPIEENDLNAPEDDSEDENLVEPPAKVRKTLDPKIVMITKGPIKENDYNAPGDDSEDENLDKTPPELRFMSDHSESGDEDCILGF